MKEYDYLIVGSGLFGAVFAFEMKKAGKRCLVIDKRTHIGGNTYCQNTDGINVHMYGAHIFHTNNERLWEYVNALTPFNRYTNSPLAIYQDKVYNLPFNMNTFYQMWGVKTPDEAKAIIYEQTKRYTSTPAKNLEEQALSFVGSDIYERFIKGYTEKQWGKKATELPAFIIKRIPLRFTYDNNYFNDQYQGIPIGGYNLLILALLNGIEVRLNTDFMKDRNELEGLAHTIVFTGKIDEFFDYRFGELEYRSLYFEQHHIGKSDFQGNAVVNYTERRIPYTRIIEHKHFEFGQQPTTIITKEYPVSSLKGNEPYYPVNDDKNNRLYQRYKELANMDKNVIFGGRLAEFKYYDMHQVIASALKMTANINNKFIAKVYD